MKYNVDIVLAFFKSEGIPEPQLEARFHPERKWRWDFSWILVKSTGVERLALEVAGGLFIGGSHTRGAALLKEYEKWNEAACAGWKILHVQPKDLCLVSTADLIKRCLGIKA